MPNNKVSAKTRKPSKPNSEVYKDSYDEKSPITGEFCVLVEEVTNPGGQNDLYKVCMQSGYQTYWNAWRESSPEILEAVEKQMPQYVVNSKYIDGNGVVWYPMMTLSPYGVLHPIKDEQNQLQWAASSIDLISSEEELKTEQVVKLPIQTTEGVQMGLFKMSKQPIKIWESNQFEDALGFYHDMVNEKIQQLQDEEE